MLSLITPTSDRPLAFALCERWMARQTYRGPMEWIVADDGIAPAPCAIAQIHLRRPNNPDPRASFCGNLVAALEHATGDKILFIEDDDWYARDYLEFACGLLDEAEIAGEGNARYYHVPTRRWQTCGNRDHASLCQTGIRRDLVAPLLELARRADTTFIDLRLWSELSAGLHRILLPESLHACGMKGLPGRGGIGIGHRPEPDLPVDLDGRQLAAWIGAFDADIYFSKFGTPLAHSAGERAGARA